MAETGQTRRGTEFVIAVVALCFQVVLVGIAVGVDLATGGDSGGGALAASVYGTCGIVMSYILGRSWVKVSENKTA